MKQVQEGFIYTHQCNISAHLKVIDTVKTIQQSNNRKYCQKFDRHIEKMKKTFSPDLLFHFYISIEPENELFFTIIRNE